MNSPAHGIVTGRSTGHNRVHNHSIRPCLGRHRIASGGIAAEGSRMLSRRSFLNRTIGAGAYAGLALATEGVQPAAAQAPAAQAPAAQPARRRIIVDSQVHLWLAQTPDRPWPADGPT